MPLLPLYAFLVTGAWVASTLRSEMTVLRGGTVLCVHAALLFAQAVSLGTATMLDGVAPTRASWPALGLFAALTAASVPLRDTWLLNRYDDLTFRTMLEHSLKQLLIPCERRGASYVLTLRSAAARVVVRTLPGKHALLRFETDPTPPKKMTLLRSLLAKRLGRLVPRPRIRFG